MGYRESKNTGNKNLNPLFVLNEGANQVEKKLQRGFRQYWQSTTHNDST
jgi:hypothetical protein